MPRAICLGEAVIDMFGVPSGVALKEVRTFSPAPGGAPANVAVGLARLGVDVGFVGTVGDDPFGSLLVETLQSEGVDTSHFRQVTGSPTTMTLVAASSPNDQDWILYRGADTKLKAEDLDRAYFASAEMLLWGSVTLSASAREAAWQALEWANADGTMVAFDANLRPAVWSSLDAARQEILRVLRGVTVCKLNETELEVLTGTNDPVSGSRRILDRGPKLCLVTLGAKGAYFHNGRAEGHVPAFNVSVVDSAGCGDAFLAGLGCGILGASQPADALDERALRSLVRFANAAGALTATCHGTMTGFATLDAVRSFLDGHPQE